MLNIGIDFGTSNSSMAAFDRTAGEVRLLPLVRQAPNPAVMRSLLYLTRGGSRRRMADHGASMAAGAGESAKGRSSLVARRSAARGVAWQTMARRW